MGGGRGDLQKCLCKSSLPSLMSFAHHPSHLLLSLPLDQHRAAPIEVSIVCT
jgi:hypothetical protein